MVGAQKIKEVVVFLAASVVFLLAGCGMEVEQKVPESAGSIEVEQKVPESLGSGEAAQAISEKVGNREADLSRTGFEAVPYFKNEFGSDTQLADGYLYSYWSRRLCRYDLDTLEEEVLYEARSPQDGSFCVAGDYVYFFERPQVTFLGVATGTLYRMGRDGSELVELASELPMSGEEVGGTYFQYNLTVYEDILYLLPRTGTIDQAIFFRLYGDGSAEQIGVEDTVYGKLREPYEDAFSCWKYMDFPPLPYCLEHYGYGFVVDAGEYLYYYDIESGYVERITALEELADPVYGYFYLTNAAILYRDADAVWHMIGLGDSQESSIIGTLDCYSFDFWDEKGIYYVKREDDHLTVSRLGWNGEQETLYYWVRNSRLSTSVYGDYVNLLYSDGVYLYFDGMDAGDGVIYRIPIEKDASDEEPQLVAVYYDSPVKDISVRDIVHTTYQVDETGDKGEFSITSVYLTEETEGAKKINAWLEDIYAEEQEYIEDQKKDVREEASLDYNWRWSSTLTEHSYATAIDYLDENYIGFCVSWYHYYNGAAHGVYGATHYVFDRRLGKRLDIMDVVEDTPEEICKIIAPYVEAVAEWGTDSEGWEKTILEQGRFYLTQEGIGIHFDVYEITCYAAGSQDVIVPYEEFQMREKRD